MTTKTEMNPRTQEILEAVDAAQQAREAWQAQQESLPTHGLRDAIVTCTEVLTQGDVPMECQAVVLAASELAVEWDNYENRGKHNQGHPRDSVWAAFDRMIEARSGVDSYQPKSIETVSQFRSQGLTDQQIAKQYGQRHETDFGTMYVGPFHDSKGRVRVDLVQKQWLHEQGQPGGEQVIPDGWVHPDERDKMERRRQELQAKVRKLETMREQQARKVEMTVKDVEAEIVSLLHEGQFPGTIANALKVPISRVMELADQENVDTVDGPVPMRETPGETEPEPSSPLNFTSVEDRIRELKADGEMDAQEIAEAVTSEFGQKLSRQKVAAVKP